MAESDAGSILEMRNICVEGRAKGRWLPILSGIDLTLRRGEVLGLIGESGAGKSTLGLMAMGFVRAQCRLASGTVKFLGQDIMALDDAGRDRLRGARVTYVAQSAIASFNPAFRLMDQTIESTVLHGLSTRQDAERDAKELYRTLGLPLPEHFGERFPHQVSGGQLQRAMTAMAMSPRPDLIIFDEPTTALDVTTQVEVLAAMRDIVRRFDTAAIYITHDLAVVSQIADTIKVMKDGREVEEASTPEMISSPQHEYTRSLWTVRHLHKPEAASDDAFIHLQGIHASYGKSLKVLEAVDIKIPRGKTVSLVGESGSGKSTVARVLAGLLPPSAGKIVFDGRDLPCSVNHRTKEDLRRIQMIYQMPDTAMNPRQTVKEIVGRPLDFYLGLSKSAANRRLVELMSLVGMDDSYLDRRPNTLSGGQKQRVCIARALAAEPDVIICDEVTSALDQVVQGSILKLLIDLQERLGITYLFITHDIATVRAISDEVVVMQGGHVMDQGMKSQVLSPPYSDYTGKLLSSVPEVDPTWLTRLLESRSLGPD